MTYLILHKVRGEPAFDVAEKVQIGDEQGWIIPTSGHRAYPYKHWLLDDLIDGSDINGAGFHDHPASLDTIPDGWPDHYQVETGSAPKPDFNIMKIISPIMTKIKRRL